MKWISIKERLPDLDVDVLFTYDGKVEFGSYVWYDPGYRWVDRIVHLYRDEVTHWMPLPVPPITLPEGASSMSEIKQRILTIQVSVTNHEEAKWIWCAHLAHQSRNGIIIQSIYEGTIDELRRPYS